MTERGMIFNDEMVRALLDGRKTQTRRIMKNQPAGDYPDTPALVRNVGPGFQWYGSYGESSIFNCPFGAVGDRIWVRETFQGPLVSEELFEEYLAHSEKFETPQYCEYAADGGCLNCGEPEPCGCVNPQPDATDAFAYLWQSIYGQENWDANPWVWVIEFRRIDGGDHAY
ncbi:TPA: hypothetical protein KEX12_001128 [Citrobacter koseri]|nr:hypothetical protein [Citrobacter koseri]